MFKILSGVVVGIFVGAFVCEVIARRHPELLEGIRRRARLTAEAAAGALDHGKSRRQVRPAS
jgi:hypothetical protein